MEEGSFKNVKQKRNPRACIKFQSIESFESGTVSVSQQTQRTGKASQKATPNIS